MQIKTLLFNLQDFFLFLDKAKHIDLNQMNEPQWQMASSSMYPNKSLEKTILTAQLIKDRDPDVLMLIEVGGSQSLENFNHYFLNNNYQIYFAPSNSDRGIDLGYLVKKSLHEKFEFKFTPHVKVKLKKGRMPARGFFQLDCIHKNKTVLTYILTHLKSKLDIKKEDFEGRTQRGAEVEYLIKFYKRFGQSHPIILAGDLNGIIYKDETEPELQKLINECNLIDVLEIEQIPVEQRATYLYFKTGGQKIPMQLDYILLQEKFSHLVVADSAQVVDTSYQVPRLSSGIQTLDDRQRLISDHFPLEVLLNLQN